MAVLSNLQPEKVFYYFEKLCSVPHGSGNTKQISDLCVGFAKELGLKYRQEACNNVIIWKNGSCGYENAAPIILQGHIDMVCAKTEEDIADYSPEEKKAFLAEMGIEASGLDNLITASYDLLGLISFLTDGKKECRAWTIRKGTKAPQAAGKIHSDFERGFIRASVIGYSDLEANNFDYAAVKAKGLQRTEGKEYVVKDGDVIEFLFNV